MDQGGETDAPLVHEGVAVIPVTPEPVREALRTALDADDSPEEYAAQRSVAGILVPVLVGMQKFEYDFGVDWLPRRHLVSQGAFVKRQGGPQHQFAEPTPGWHRSAVFFRDRRVGQEFAQEELARSRTEEQAPLGAAD